MKLWKRAAGALKDHKSVWIAAVSRRSVYRNPDLEAAVIRATSHDESCVDYKNVQRVFAWVRMSPTYLRPFVEAISARMERTRSWPVALKGLMLMHGVFYCKIHAVQQIGRLPFDLSNFSDSHLSPDKAWGYNIFIRAYFTFLDQKSAFLCWPIRRGLPRGTSRAVTSGGEKTTAMVMMADLTMLQELQSLLDLLLQIEPQTQGMRRAGLVLETMNCVITEIFNIYSKTCELIARVLSRVHDSTRDEASTALSVLHQANKQADQLSRFFELCNTLGVLSTSEFPKVEQVNTEDIEVVKRVLDGRIPTRQKTLTESVDDLEQDEGTGGAITVRETAGSILSAVGQQKKFLTTIVTDEWEVFEDESLKADDADNDESSSNVRAMGVITATDPLAAYPNTSNNLHLQPYRQEIPDLITF